MYWNFVYKHSDHYSGTVHQSTLTVIQDLKRPQRYYAGYRKLKEDLKRPEQNERKIPRTKQKYRVCPESSRTESFPPRKSDGGGPFRVGRVQGGLS